MAGKAAGTILGCTGAAAAAFVCPSQFLSPAKAPISQNSSSHVVLSCRDGAKSALVPSCLYFAARACNDRTLPVRNCRASLLPSSLCSSSFSSSYRYSFVHSGDGKIEGLAVGFNGDLKRASMNPRTAGANVRSMAGQPAADLEEIISTKNSQNAVVLYSKSWCPLKGQDDQTVPKVVLHAVRYPTEEPGHDSAVLDSFRYCGMVKGLFKKVGAPFELVELDELVDEEDVQDALRRLTGQSTVPSVFIGGKHIGGCDDTMALHQRGELIPALEAAGLKITGA